MIHVCFGLHDKTGRYAKFTGTTILSLFENTNSNVTIHLLHDNTLTQDNREKFIYLAGEYHQLVKFYNVEELCADKIAYFWERIPAIKTLPFGIGTMYRLLIPQLLLPEITKVIYLDSDIIVNLNIAELWRMELDDKPLAAVTEISNGVDAQKMIALCREGYVKEENYFNAGVLLMNLNILHEKESVIMEGIKFIVKYPQFSNIDQDFLNYCFSTQSLHLPMKFNTFIRDARRRSEKQVEQKIYHYLSGTFGYGILLNINDSFNRLWMKYFMKTPWFDEETIRRLYTGVQNLHVSLKQSMVNLSAILSGKTRAFFTPPRDVDGLKKFFSIRDDEEIILAENQTSLQKLIDAMKNSQGKKVFFIMLPNFPYQALIQAGFVPNRDFLNGLEFLSEAQGVPLNSYPFIQGI